MPQGAEVRPATTVMCEFWAEVGGAGAARARCTWQTCARPPRSLTHVRTTYRPHQSPPTRLRLTYQQLVHGPACEVGMVGLFLRGPGCRPKSTLLGGGAEGTHVPPPRQRGMLAHTAVNHARQ